jgi:hypothetical protein
MIGNLMKTPNNPVNPGGKLKENKFKIMMRWNSEKFCRSSPIIKSFDEVETFMSQNLRIKDNDIKEYILLMHEV